MKKFFALFLALGAAAFAGEGESMIQAYSVVAAGVGLGLAALGGAVGMGNTAAATIAGTARNPGLGGKLMTRITSYNVCYTKLLRFPIEVNRLNKSSSELVSTNA